VVVRFGPFTLDDGARTLRKGARALHLSPKAFDLLAQSEPAFGGLSYAGLGVRGALLGSRQAAGSPA